MTEDSIRAVKSAAKEAEAASASEAAAQEQLLVATDGLTKASAALSKLDEPEGLLASAVAAVKGKAGKAPASPEQVAEARAARQADVDAGEDNVAAARATLEAAQAAGAEAEKALQEAQGVADKASKKSAQAGDERAKREDDGIADGTMVRVRSNATRAGDVILMKDQVYTVDKATADRYIRRNYATLIED